MNIKLSNEDQTLKNNRKIIYLDTEGNEWQITGYYGRYEPHPFIGMCGEDICSGFNASGENMHLEKWNLVSIKS